MNISVIILSYRNPSLLRLCLKALRHAQSVSEEMEVIVVDNATTVETRNVVEEEFSAQFENIRIVPIRENAGYTRGVNEGIRASTGEFILALNYDIVLQEGAIELMASYLRNHPATGLIGPRLLNFDETHQDSYFRFYRPFTILSRRLTFLPGARDEEMRFSMTGSNHQDPQIVDWVSGAAFMTTRTALREVGYLDESLFHYFSDVDWAWRFWENGYQVGYIPAAVMYHYLGRTSKGHFGFLDPLFNRATRWHIMDALRYFRKHGLSGQRPQQTLPLQPGLLNTQA